MDSIARPPAPMEPVPWPAAFDDPGWLWQLKWDGMRALAQCGTPRLWSRRGLDRTEGYPEVAAALATAAGGHPALLDGELVALGEDGKPSLARLLRRGGRQRPTPTLLARIPVTYAVFDVLAWDGRDIRGQPLEERLAYLDRLGPAPHLYRVRGHLGGGRAFVAAVAAAGLEGAVAKRRGSAYAPGPSRLWRKIKPRRTLTALIVGCRRAPGGRLRSLALGLSVDGALTYVGNVGAGLTEPVRRRLTQALADPRAPAPPGGAPPGGCGEWQWVEPRLCATVTYAEWTPHGRLRAPVLVGIAARPGPGG